MVHVASISATANITDTSSHASDRIASSIVKVSYFGAAIETLLFGVFLVLFPQAIYVLLRYPRVVSLGSVSHFNKTVLVVCCILLCSVTAVSSFMSFSLFDFQR